MGQYWNTTGFDLWEEVMGSSFFTTQSQYRSLVDGAALAKKLGVSCAACEQQANLLCFMQSSYWNGRYIMGNINTNHGRVGIDANTIIGPTTVAFDVNASCDSPSMQPCNPRVLATFKVLVDTFRDESLYPINAGIPSSEGVALGRYPEDFYYNGNPWYLITLGAAELLYDAVAQWTHQGQITVDETSLPFFRDLYPQAKAGAVYKRCKKSGPFRKIVDAATAYAESFIAVVQKYTPEDGALAEQFTKTEGVPISAERLTWSFAAFVAMNHRREGKFPPSWVPPSSSVKVPETTCVASSVEGTYAPALGAGAPDVPTPNCTSTVLFMLNATTYYGENLYLTGDSADLGRWDLGSAQPLQSSNYTAERPLWYARLPLTTPGETVTYKYAREQDCGRPWIVEERNRTLVVPACVANSTAVLYETDEVFEGPGGTPGGC